MKKRNQIMAITAAVTVLSASTVMAEYMPDREPVYRGEDVVTTSAVSMAEDYTISVNGVQLEKKGYLENGKVMVPVRAIAEALGFEVTWNGEAQRVELLRGANYITFRIGVDGYTFAKTAPMPLGVAPVEINGTTFVPVNFAEEILHTDVAVDPAGVVTIADAAEAHVSAEAVISDVKDGVVEIEDAEMGTVILHIGDMTELIGANGETITVSALEKDMKVLVVYGDVMMESLPPQNVPISITVAAEAEKAEDAETVSVTGTVLSAEEGQITIGEDAEKPATQLALNVDENTKVTKDGEAITLADIKAGDEIAAVHAAAMTKSIPAQAYAYEIEVKKAAVVVEEETAELTGKIAEVSEEGVVIGDAEDPHAQTVLLVSEETTITDKDGKAIELKDLKAGMEIKAVHKTMMTMSIPAQTPALSITVIG